MERFQIKGAPTCRVAYVDTLFEKKSVKGADGDPKYSAVILIPKDDEAKVKQIMDEYNKAFADLQAKGFKGKTPKAINPKNNALEDGDEYADQADGRDAFRGYYRLKVASKNFRPIITDRSRLVICNDHPVPGITVDQMSDQRLESGDYILCNVSFWTYNNPTAQGIGANVHAIVKMADGERISGVSNNVDDYIDLESYE